MSWRGSAHGKCILIGEHAVVHGTTAIAMPVGLQVNVELDEGEPLAGLPDAFTTWFRNLATERTGRALVPVSADGDLPQGAGLGSSAALSVAALRALDAAGGKVDHELIALADEAERIFHGNPSGIDVRTVCADGPITYRRTAAGPDIAPLPRCAAPLWFELWMTPPGLPTAEVVARVSASLDRSGRDGALADAEATVQAARTALLAGDVAGLGSAMTHFHRWLAQHGASTDLLDELVQLALDHGAPGAKLTGGGGGGTMIVLLPDATWTAPQLPADVARARFVLET
ncbi:MAG: mevalonate kinase [Candidatus Dadabacteria bacterium]|nr:MAG: mevalonate kinase [Candidatus Dadabacteria bacterium]